MEKKIKQKLDYLKSDDSKLNDSLILINSRLNELVDMRNLGIHDPQIEIEIEKLTPIRDSLNSLINSLSSID